MADDDEIKRLDLEQTLGNLTFASPRDYCAVHISSRPDLLHYKDKNGLFVQFSVNSY